MRTASGKRGVGSGKRLKLAFLLLLVFSTLTATRSTLSAATTGAAFLTLGDGSRPLALGGAYAAMPGDVDSLYYNPGALAWQKNPEVAFTHSEWLESTNLDLISYAHPTSAGTFGASALRLGGGNFEGRDSNRQKTGDFSADDIACLFSYSHKVGAYVGLGGNLKYLRSRIENESASTIAFDGGVSGKIPGHPLWLGGSVLNVGSGLRFVDQVDRLPLMITLGSAYEPMKRLRVLFDFVHEPYEGRNELRGGGEFSIALFDFRLGYVQPLSGVRDRSLSAGEHLRGGFGIHWSRYRADYTLAPIGDLGLTQRFTVGIAFGAPSEDEHNLQAVGQP